VFSRRRHRDEAFGETVRRGPRGATFDHLDICLRQHRVERRRELTDPVADETSKPADMLAEICQQVAGLLAPDPEQLVPRRG
jgi:hypothetical protein